MLCGSAHFSELSVFVTVICVWRRWLPYQLTSVYHFLLDLWGVQCHQGPWSDCSGACWEWGHHCRGNRATNEGDQVSAVSSSLYFGSQCLCVYFSGAETYSGAGDHWSWRSCAQPPRGGKMEDSFIGPYECRNAENKEGMAGFDNKNRIIYKTQKLPKGECNF